MSYQKIINDNNRSCERLAEATKVDLVLARNIFRFVKCLAKPSSGLIDQEIFNIVLSKYFDIVDQMFVRKIYFKNARQENAMTIEEFANLLCVFMTDCLELKIKYVFNVYDNNGDGVLEVSELISNVRVCKVVSDVDDGDNEETFLDMCMMAIQTLNLTSDGINMKTFGEKVRENGLFLGILGQSLPSVAVVERFRQQIGSISNVQMLQVYGDIRQQLLFEPPTTEQQYYPFLLDLP